MKFKFMYKIFKKISIFRNQFNKGLKIWKGKKNGKFLKSKICYFLVVEKKKLHSQKF